MGPPARSRALPSAWIRLVLSIRLLAVVTAVVLLLLHRVTSHDLALVAAGCAYLLASALAVRFTPSLLGSRVTWAVDVGIVLTLVALSGDWRSPFFLLAVVTLVVPSAALPMRQAIGAGLAFSLVYFVMGLFIGPDVLATESQTTLETLATHLVTPVLVAFGVAYAAHALRDLEVERRRVERLAIEAERRRIAWELHDSAKARVHAAHLVLSSLDGASAEVTRAVVAQALGELEAATADMGTSLAELQSPLEGRPLGQALRERAQHLAVPDGPVLTVHGDVGDLEPLSAAHAYRIAGEALINAARHARASRIDVTLSEDDDGAHVVVRDDGRGMPQESRLASNGLRVMHSRARTIGAALEIGPGADGSGTVVALHIPKGAT